MALSQSSQVVPGASPFGPETYVPHFSMRQILQSLHRHWYSWHLIAFSGLIRRHDGWYEIPHSKQEIRGSDFLKESYGFWMENFNGHFANTTVILEILFYEPKVIFATSSKAHVANWKLLSRWLVDIFVSFLIRWFISQNNFGISSSFRRFFFKHTLIYTTSNCQSKFMRYFIFSQRTIWILIISLDPKSTI